MVIDSNVNNNDTPNYSVTNCFDCVKSDDSHYSYLSNCNDVKLYDNIYLEAISFLCFSCNLQTDSSRKVKEISSILVGTKRPLPRMVQNSLPLPPTYNHTKSSNLEFSDKFSNVVPPVPYTGVLTLRCHTIKSLFRRNISYYPLFYQAIPYTMTH